jgi:peptide/nickel transport system ATP-binding protein
LADGSDTACRRVDEIGEEMAERRRTTLLSAVVDTGEIRGPNESLVRVTNLEKVFGSDGGRVAHALSGVTIEIGADESVGLVGESGSGKTTLGRCLVGLERATAGSIVIDGIDASDYGRLSGNDRRRLRQTVQMVFQDPSSTLNPVRTVDATLREALLVANPKLRNVRSEVGRLLEQVGLPPDYAGRKPVALSGGERQRVAIARALAPRPQLIVCDEAVSALDVSVQAQILNLLADVREQLGVSFLFITHDLGVVRQIADRVYVLRGGELLESGRTADVLDNPQHSYTRALVASTPTTKGDWLASKGLQ